MVLLTDTVSSQELTWGSILSTVVGTDGAITIGATPAQLVIKPYYLPSLIRSQQQQNGCSLTFFSNSYTMVLLWVKVPLKLLKRLGQEMSN
ncbi:MAG: hypothetical protein R3E08_04475 [Thiotrichaceae bacterium]